MRWPFPAGSQLTTIDVTPADVTMAVGEQIEFTAVGNDQSGSRRPARESDVEPRRNGNRRAGPLNQAAAAPPPPSPPPRREAARSSARRRSHRRGLVTITEPPAARPPSRSTRPRSPSMSMARSSSPPRARTSTGMTSPSTNRCGASAAPATATFDPATGDQHHLHGDLSRRMHSSAARRAVSRAPPSSRSRARIPGSRPSS